MSPLDRNAKRITTIRNAMRAGRLKKEDGERMIAKIEGEGPKIVARYTDPLGREVTEPAKDWKDAERIEAMRKREMESGAFVAPKLLDATLLEMLDFYLTKKMHRNGKPRESFKNARAHRDHAERLLGPRVTLRQILQDRGILAYHFGQAEPRPTHRSFKRVDFTSPGSTLNYLITLSAAAAYYIKKHLLQVANPFDVVDRTWKKGRRLEKITWEQHLRLIEAARGIDPETERPFPAWVAAYFEAGWETGWRAGEVQDWAWERLTLDPPAGDLPWVKTLIEKQHQEVPVYEEKPISERLAAILRALPAPQKERGRVFLGGRTTVDRTARRVFNVAGLPGKKFHDYRRSMRDRVKLIEGLLPVGLGAQYQGWADGEMPERYEVEQRKVLEVVVRTLAGQNRDKTGGDGE